MNGNEAMSTSVVISEVDDGNTFVARINGTNTEIYYIYCNSTDICKINCQSSGACTKLFLYCFGTCYVACDEDNGIDCPFAGVYFDLATPSPTSPTEGPSGYPTHLPTAIPIQDQYPSGYPAPSPTVIPTYDPSGYPTSRPTMLPSSEPTTEEPSLAPSRLPTDIPILIPTTNPTMTTINPSHNPTNSPNTNYNGASTTESNNEVGQNINGDKNNNNDKVAIEVIIVASILFIIMVFLIWFIRHQLEKKKKRKKQRKNVVNISVKDVDKKLENKNDASKKTPNVNVELIKTNEIQEILSIASSPVSGSTPNGLDIEYKFNTNVNGSGEIDSDDRINNNNMGENMTMGLVHEIASENVNGEGELRQSVLAERGQINTMGAHDPPIKMVIDMVNMINKVDIDHNAPAVDDENINADIGHDHDDDYNYQDADNHDQLQIDTKDEQFGDELRNQAFIEQDVVMNDIIQHIDSQK